MTSSQFLPQPLSKPVSDIPTESDATCPIQVDVWVQISADDAHHFGNSTPQATASNSHAVSLTEMPWTLIPWDGWFLQWLTYLQPTLSPIHAYELTMRLTTDQEIQSLNAQYRDKNQPTDVLAFATLDLDDELPNDLAMTQPYYLGDLIISLETASIQANEAGHSLTCELAWLATHGLLHLLGWDHPDAKRLEDMLNEQRMLLSLIDALKQPS